MATKNVNAVVLAYRVINTAKLTKMEDAEKFAIIKAMRCFKKISSEFDDFLKDAQERLKPDNFAVVTQKIHSNKNLTPEELAIVNKYDQDVSNCLKEEFGENVDLSFTPLSEEAVERFIASNDFSVNEIMLIMDVLGE